MVSRPKFDAELNFASSSHPSPPLRLHLATRPSLLYTHCLALSIWYASAVRRVRVQRPRGATLVVGPFFYCSTLYTLERID